MSVSAIVYLDADCADRATALGLRCGLRVIDGSAYSEAKVKVLSAFLAEQLGTEMALVFILSAEGLRLHATGEMNCSIRADFHGPTVTYRRKQGGGRGQMIAKAVGLKPGYTPRVLDCTAGLGGDGFVLASLGCEVTLLERTPSVVLLLEDALEQARIYAETSDPELLPILERMHLLEADGHEFLRSDAHGGPDVVYLDPMFPVRTKSAQVKKEMQVFHHLVGQDLDADGLLEEALKVAGSRVVVKRPRIAPALSGPAPSHVYEGKSNRFDVYIV